MAEQSGLREITYKSMMVDFMTIEEAFQRG